MLESFATRIGVALVEHRGKLLVGTRGSDGPLPGKSEFPGGKARPGESSRECAERECREETGLSVVAVERLDAREFAYPHGTVALEFWLCRAQDADIQPEHGGFAWVAVGDLLSRDFPAANGPVLAALLQRFAST